MGILGLDLLLLGAQLAQEQVRDSDQRLAISRPPLFVAVVVEAPAWDFGPVGMDGRHLNRRKGPGRMRRPAVPHLWDLT